MLRQLRTEDPGAAVSRGRLAIFSSWGHAGRPPQSFPFYFQMAAQLILVGRVRCGRILETFVSLIQRHFCAAWYVLTVIVPVILRTGRRPVIFSRFAGMGDILCTFPAALELKKRHPQAPFIYNCAAGFACLPAMGGVTERVTHLHPIGLVGHWYRALLSGYYNFA